MDINDMLDETPVTAFADADREAKEVADLKAGGKSKAGRKMSGKSKATNKIAFYVDDEQLEYLKAMLDYDKKLSTPNAVAKMLFVRDYDLHRKD